jgi:hypothetical protein
MLIFSQAYGVVYSGTNVAIDLDAETNKKK